MIHIPSSEIKQPDLHADTLGFTFVWQGHFLRGIFPQSVELAKSYFETGFLDEVISKGLFPKTWISEYENEQFGMILEHEMISPVLFATEWNYLMLLDAAKMVVEIASIGWKYGYNMIDCHKRNVLFLDNKPLYVDIGSFVNRDKGSIGWHPYYNFMCSYYYILDIWKDGTSQIAKRLMAPGVELSQKDYYKYKYPLFRRFNKTLNYYLLLKRVFHYLSSLSNDRVQAFLETKPKYIRVIGLIAKKNANRLSVLSAPKTFSRLLKKLEKRNFKQKTYKDDLPNEKEVVIKGFINLVLNHFESVTSITFVNNKKKGYYESLVSQTKIARPISIQEDEYVSNLEYHRSNEQKLQLCSCYFRLLNNTILVRNEFPEIRFRSDLVYLPQVSMIAGNFSAHNYVVFIEHCIEYARIALVLRLEKQNEELVRLLEKGHKITIIPINNLVEKSDCFLEENDVECRMHKPASEEYEQGEFVIVYHG